MLIYIYNLYLGINRYVWPSINTCMILSLKIYENYFNILIFLAVTFVELMWDWNGCLNINNHPYLQKSMYVIVIWIYNVLILSSGADPNLRDFSGKKAKQYLRNSAHSRAQRKSRSSVLLDSTDSVITTSINLKNTGSPDAGVPLRNKASLTISGPSDFRRVKSELISAPTDFRHVQSANFSSEIGGFGSGSLRASVKVRSLSPEEGGEQTINNSTSDSTYIWFGSLLSSVIPNMTCARVLLLCVWFLFEVAFCCGINVRVTSFTEHRVQAYTSYICMMLIGECRFNTWPGGNFTLWETLIKNRLFISIGLRCMDFEILYDNARHGCCQSTFIII